MVRILGLSRKWYLLAGLGVLLVVPVVLSNEPFLMHIYIMLCLYGVLGQAWNIIGGYAGQVSLGHTVFFGVGAYTSTILLLKVGLSPWIGMVAGMGLSALSSAVIGYPCFRLSGKYFVIATIAVLQIAQTLVIGLEALGGAAGLSLPIQTESFWAFQFHSSKNAYAYIALAMMAIATIITYLMSQSRSGFYFRAIRESEDAAESLGVDTVKYKLYAMIISAVLTSAAGTFYAQYIMYIDPRSVFSYPMAIKMCLLTTLGGAGTVLGPIIGTLILVPLSELSRAYLGGGGSGVDLIVYGIILTLIAIYRPDGIAGLIRQTGQRLGSKGGINPETHS
jgi:branched-chain amino acid transport system permease protein